MSQSDLSIVVPNNQVGFFPSISWEIKPTDISVITKAPFFWVQAFWDSTDYTGGIPTLLVSKGDNSPVSPILFAFSGEMKPFKGKAFWSSGNDRYGNSQTATPINPASTTDSLTKVIVYGGAY